MKLLVKYWSVVTIGMILLALPLHAEFLYIANGDSNNITAYRIMGNGALTPIVGSPFPSGKWPVWVVVDIPGQFLYTANMYDDTISAFRIHSDGSLTHLADTGAGSMPKALAVDHFGRFLYVTNLDGTGIPEYGGTVGHVSAYRINLNGTLTRAPGSPVPAGYSPLSVAADPTGRFVYVANAGGQHEPTETISGYSVTSTGTLTPLSGSPFLDGESPQAIAVDPFSRFLYTVGDYDLALLTYRIAGTGILTKLPGSSFHTYTGYEPWNDAVVADPFGRFVYRSRCIGDNPNAAIISVYQVGTNGLTFSSFYPAKFLSDSMVVDNSGQYLYAGVNTVKGTYGPVGGTGVAAYRILSNGTLTPVVGSPFQVGLSADSLAINR